MSYSKEFALKCVSWFNERLDGQTDGNFRRKTTLGEVVKFWGYLGALALYPGEAVDHMWRKTMVPGDILPPPSMGIHGMSKNRFMKLRSLQGEMYTKDELELDPADPWRYCRAPVEALNEQRRKVLIPSWLLVGDESMSAFTGAEGVLDGANANSKPIPLRHLIERKPEPLGLELKVLADGCSGVFLGMGIQEGLERHVDMKWYDDYGHSTAVSLRLLEPYFKTKTGPGREMPTRVYGGDSWFMSVGAAEAIFYESGKVIYPFGDVKTNTSRFPREKLAQACGPNSGDWATFTSKCHLVDDTYMDIMAVAHRRGPEIHTFVATAGETTVGNPQSHKDDDLDADTGYLIARKCPKVLNDWTQAQPKIDKHNRLRQQILAMEKRFVTESFPFRLFTTVLGIMFVDAYYIYLYLNNMKAKDFPFKSAMRRMAFAFMHNNLDAIERGDKNSDELFNIPQNLELGAEDEEEEGEDGDGDTSSRGIHQAIPLRQIEGYTGARQQWCCVCQKSKVTFACSGCSSKGMVFAIHPLKKHANQRDTETCLHEHRRDPLAHRAIPVRRNSSAESTTASTSQHRRFRGRTPDGEDDQIPVAGQI